MPNGHYTPKIVTTYLQKCKLTTIMDIQSSVHKASGQRLSSDERQREIVAAVLALARERGPDAITTQAIADRIGVTQGAIFRHFPHKEAIWMAVFAWVRESLGTLLATAVAQRQSPLAKIEAAFFAHVAFIATNPGVPRVLFHELQYPGDSPVRAEVQAMIAGYRERLTALFTEALTIDAANTRAQGLVIESALAGNEDAMMARAQQMFPLLVHGYRGPQEA